MEDGPHIDNRLFVVIALISVDARANVRSKGDGHMVRLIRFTLVVVVILGVVATVSATADDSTNIKDRFLSSNPNNGWEYGFIDQNGTFIRYNSTFDDGEGIAGWALDHAPGICGDVTINYTGQPIDRYGLHWEPGQICVNTPAMGQGTAVRWHATDQSNIAIDTGLTAQAPGVEASAKVVVDGKPVTSVTIGESSITGAAQTQAVKSSLSVMSSSTAQVVEGSTIDLIISPVDRLTLGHISTSIDINLIGPAGDRLSKTSPNKHEDDKQAQKPQKLSCLPCLTYSSETDVCLATSCEWTLLPMLGRS